MNTNKRLTGGLLLTLLVLLAVSAFGQGPVTERKLSSFGKVTSLGQTDLVAVSVAPGTVSEQLRGITVSNLNRMLSNAIMSVVTNGFVGIEITNGLAGKEITNGFPTFAGASNMVIGILLGRLDPSGTLPLAGWGIDTPTSQYEGLAATGNMHGFVLRSLGSPFNITNGGGDGFVQIASNLAASNSAWINYKGDLDYSATSNFKNRRAVLRTSLQLPVFGGGAVTVAGSSNVGNALIVSTKGSRITVGSPLFSTSGSGGSVTINASNAILGGMLFSSTAATVNSDTSEDTLLTATVPAGALTNSQDAVEFMITGRLANDPANKRLRVYYGSSLVCDSLDLTPSNTTFRITGTITANADLTSQYVEGSISWKTPNIYTHTNWSLTITETNGLDTRLRVTGLASAANVITNECLKVRIQPAGPYTQ